MQPNTQQVIPVEVANNLVAQSALITAQQWEISAQSYVIDCPELAEAANSDLQQIKKFANDLEELRVQVKKEPLDRCKAIDSFFKAPADYLKSAEAVLKQRIGAFLIEQRRKQEEEEQRQRIAQEVEQRRLHEEQQRLALELQQQADAELESSLATAETTEEIDAIAQRHDNALQQAADVQSAPLPFVPTVAIAPAAKLKGISTPSVWKAELTDKKEFIKYALASDREDLLALLVFDQKAADGIARALKNQFKAPGITVSEVMTVASRAAR